MKCVLVVKTKATYALAMQGTRASGAIVSTLVYVIVAYSVWEKKKKKTTGPEWDFLYGTTKKVIDNQIQVLELMQMHPKERLRRVILTASWFIAINVGQFVPENSLRFPWHILIFYWRDLVNLVDL